MVAVRGLHEGGARGSLDNRNNFTCIVEDGREPLGPGAQHLPGVDQLGEAARPVTYRLGPVNKIFSQLTGSITKDEDPFN